MRATWSVHGLIAKSDFVLDRFPSASIEAADLRIRRGTVPAEPRDFVDRGLCWAAGPERFWLDVAGVARFEVVGDREILVDPHPRAAERRVVDFLTDRPLAVILARRGFWAIRGIAVAVRGKAWILSSEIPGFAWHMADRLEARGTKTLCGVQTVLRGRDDGRSAAIVGGERAALVVRRRFVEALERRILDEDRPMELPLAGVVEMRLTANQPSSFVPLSGAERFSHLSDLLVASSFLGGLGLQAAAFTFVSRASAALRQIRGITQASRAGVEAMMRSLWKELSTWES